MKKAGENTTSHFFEKMALRVTKATGSTPAFVCALIVVLIWLASGPFFNFSEAWQLIINTVTTITTFLMVFLIQKAQNKDSMAIQLKLNELVASHEHASNRLIDVENITEDELKVIQKYYAHLSQSVKKEESLQQSHSIDEAKLHHKIKSATREKKKHV